MSFITLLCKPTKGPGPSVNLNMMNVVEKVGLFVPTSKEDSHLLQRGDLVTPGDGVGYDTQHFCPYRLASRTQPILEPGIEPSQEDDFELSSNIVYQVYEMPQSTRCIVTDGQFSWVLDKMENGI